MTERIETHLTAASVEIAAAKSLLHRIADAESPSESDDAKRRRWHMLLDELVGDDWVGQGTLFDRLNGPSYGAIGSWLAHCVKVGLYDAKRYGGVRRRGTLPEPSGTDWTRGTMIRRAREDLLVLCAGRGGAWPDWLLDAVMKDLSANVCATSEDDG